jgi:hypothetical protein
MTDTARCKGAWELGSACGKCWHCLETAPSATKAIQRLHGEITRLQRLLDAENSAQLESSKLRIALVKVFHRTHDHVIKDACANALGKSVEQLETGA